MGYNTDFYITIEDDDFEVDYLIEIITQHNGYYVYELENWFFFETKTVAITDVKWYNFENDIKVISSYFPDKLIIVKGFGEDYDDFWIAYVKNGIVRKENTKIVYPKFDIETMEFIE